MRKTILLYGIAMAVLISAMKYMEYRVFIRDYSVEFYAGMVAIIFTAIGIWAGRKLTRKPIVVVQETFAMDEGQLKKLGISKREHEVLVLIAGGLSNQEIADRLFLSVNTIKTHSSNLFIKLEASRRTQAIQRAKELRLIP